MTQEAVPPAVLEQGAGENGALYPSEEKQTMPLSDMAVRLITYLFMALNHLFENRADCYVGADQFFFWDPLDARKRIAPDVYVLFGAPKRPLRSVWRLWEVPTPVLVVEVSSPKSRREDRGRKLRIYRDLLRVPEYLIYDEATAEMLLYRLEAGEYVRQEPDGRDWLYSSGLNVWFEPDPELGIRVYGPDGRPEPWLTELYQVYDDARGEAAAIQIARMELGQALKERDEAVAAERREAAERRRLTELQRMIEVERRQTEVERQRAEQERLRADGLAAELERLRAERREQGNGE